MIHYLLYSVPKDKISQSRKKYFWVIIISLSILCFSAVALVEGLIYFPNNKQLNCILVSTGLLSIVCFIFSLFLANNKMKKTVRFDYHEYNEELDHLRTALINADYNDSSDPSTTNKPNWYTEDKVKYLIQEFDNLLSNRSTKYDSSVDILKNALIPIISFAGGAIADKAELKTTIRVALLIILAIFSIWGIAQFLKTISDELFYNRSDTQIKKIHSLLKDLYIRDFDDTAPSTSNSSSQTNIP